MLSLNINDSIFNRVYINNGNLFDYTHRWNIYYGGA